MRTKRINVPVVGICMILCLMFLSCNDDVYVIHNNHYKSMFTVKPDGEDSYHFRSDKGKTYAAVNDIHNYSPEKDQRAVVYYSWVPDADVDETMDYGIHVYRIDTILSKQIAQNLYEENEKTYGNDPVRLNRMWVGGGFLNIRFTTLWGGYESHFVNLVQEEDNDPYTLRFRHHAYNDPGIYQGYAWVAFDLSSLDKTMGSQEEVQLTIKVQTYEGLNEYTFTYKPGQQNDEENDDEEEVEMDEEERDVARFMLK